ncbi:MAG: sodium:alanine symporter family protein [Opitutales bacterium]|nr:sodium:alanine symporter family protein [Opitutales bacterium]
MEWIEDLNARLNSIVWGPPFMILLVGTGLYLSFRLGFFQFTHFRFIWLQTVGKLCRRETEGSLTGSITPFQAVSSAMAATIGVGNIAGVATAMALGGPGAVFWMWIVALVGMATKFGEATLGTRFRQVDADGRISGGVFYYIEKGLGPRWKPLAMLYALFAALAAFGIGNMVQANTLAHALDTGFNVPRWAAGLGAVLLVGAVTLGGIQRIGKAAERIVPVMAVIYVFGALLILALHFREVPAALWAIVYHAFVPAAAAGGFAGAMVAEAVRYGIARGIFSNEAGLGSASIVYAQSRNTPVGQGMWAIWEVFIDTMVICTMTALVIMVTGALETGTTGAELASMAFTKGLPGAGGYLVLVGLVLFSYTTMLTWNFYGEKSCEYLTGKRSIPFYRVVFLLLIPVGALIELELIWAIADTLNGLMAAPNLIALLALGGVLTTLKRRALKKGREQDAAE